MVIFQPSIQYNYFAHCNRKFDSNFGTRNKKFFHISVIILEQLIGKLWPELWAEWRNFNPEIISTFMHYSTEIIGPLVIMNVYWKFELQTIKGWSFFSHQSNTIIGHIAIGSLIQILELETRNFFLFQLLFLSKCYAIFDLNCEPNEGT